MAERSNDGSWRRRITVAGLLAWVAYKVSNTRRATARLAPATTWDTHPGCVADMSQFGAEAASIRCEEWDIGTGVTGYVWKAGNPRAALLLQHGYAEYSQRYVTQYHQLIPHLLNAGMNVYAFDLWGHGHSPGKRAVTDIREAVRDHLAARRVLRDQPLPVFLLGHSLGGLVTASSMVRDQRDVSGVILTSSVLQNDATRALLLFARTAAFVAPTMPVPVTDGEAKPLYRGAEHDEAFSGDQLFYRGRLPMLLAGTAGQIAADNWARYPDWRAPVLVVHGTADDLTDPQGSQRLFDTITAADKSLHIVEGGYHELLNDLDADETLRVLLSWLDERIKSS